MPQSTPKAAVLLEAAVKYLESELMPTLDGYYRFQTRVTVNVLNTVRRELELRSAQAEAERSRLVAILGHDGEVEALSVELAEKIRAGAISIDDPASARPRPPVARRRARNQQSQMDDSLMAAVNDEPTLAARPSDLRRHLHPLVGSPDDALDLQTVRRRSSTRGRNFRRQVLRRTRPALRWLCKPSSSPPSVSES